MIVVAVTLIFEKYKLIWISAIKAVTGPGELCKIKKVKEVFHLEQITHALDGMRIDYQLV